MPTGVSAGHGASSRAPLLSEIGGVGALGLLLLAFVIYRRRPGVGAVIHCHPLSCTVLAVLRRPFRSTITPEAIMVLGDLVPTVAYATPGSGDLAEKISGGLGEAKACLLESHGALAVGKDLLDAFNRMDTLEYIASLQLRGEELGGLEDLPSEEIARITEMTK